LGTGSNSSRFKVQGSKVEVGVAASEFCPRLFIIDGWANGCGATVPDPRFQKKLESLATLFYRETAKEAIAT